MSKIDDGGPAFPVPMIPCDRYGSYTSIEFGGMTLRDWFAGQASEADITHWFDVFYANGISKTREECKYAHADAMLAARKGGGA
jgi:hypothetical protein